SAAGGSPAVEECPTSSFSSAMETAGMSFRKTRKKVKNHPKEPTVMPISTRLGRYTLQSNGMRLCEREVTTMLNRSSHIPTLTTIPSANRAGPEPRTREEKSERG